MDQIVFGKINQKIHSSYELKVINYLKEWFSDKEEYEFQTSGSTGSPKKLFLTKEQLTYSASSSIQFLFGRNVPKNALLCINPDFVGGRQVIYRAAIHGMDLTIVEPASNPPLTIKDPIGLTSLVPLQVKDILENNPEKLNLLSCVLIGGADLSEAIREELKKFEHTRFYQTFGMTETASHIALREINSEAYVPIGNIQLKVDERSCLAVNGSVTNNTWLQTNDVVQLNDNSFEWLGRVDFVVNSGGVKLHPEVIESKIRNHFATAFALSGRTSEHYGDELVLVTVTPMLNEIRNRKILDRYEIPKAEVLISELPKLPSGKLDRISLKKMISES